MGTALAEVVLDEPGGPEAELVGQLHLLQRGEVRVLLGLALPVGMRLAPGKAGVQLVEAVELQRMLLFRRSWLFRGPAPLPSDDLRATEEAVASGHRRLRTRPCALRRQHLACALHDEALVPAVAHGVAD